jgi:hypothetical protein
MSLSHIVLVIGMLGCSCAAPPTRCDLAVRDIDATVKAFGEAHPKQVYPRTLAELTAFAASRGRQLDLGAFAKITLERSAKSVSITYEERERHAGRRPRFGGLYYDYLH